MKEGIVFYDSVKKYAIKKQKWNYISYEKKNLKEVSIQGVPSSSSDFKDDAIPKEYWNNTLNWEHVGSIHSTQILPHTHRSCNIVIGVIYRPNSETGQRVDSQLGEVEIRRGDLLR